MADKRRPGGNRLRERLHRPDYQDGRQRDPIRRATQLPPRPQLPNQDDHLDDLNVPDQGLNFPAHNIPNRPRLPDHGHRLDHRNVHHHNQRSQTPVRPHQPYHLQPDHRLPTPGSYPSTPISLSSPDGFATHLLLLLSPSSHILFTLLADAKKSRVPTSHIPPEDVVERALENRTLMHVSDGPSGGIWVVAAEKPEVLACLVAEMQGGWEFLGVGKGGNEGMMFLRHPCGFGPEEEEEEEKKETERAKVAGKRRNRERGQREQRVWESDEDSDEGDHDLWGGRNRVRDQGVDRGRDRERAQNVDRGRGKERGRAVERDREGGFHRDGMRDQNQEAIRIQQTNRYQQRTRAQDEQIVAADIFRDFEDGYKRF